LGLLPAFPAMGHNFLRQKILSQKNFTRQNIFWRKNGFFCVKNYWYINFLA